MATYTLKFEHSLQECAFVEVEADSMDQAIEKARDMDTQEMDLEWESDGYYNTDDRLYSVESDEGYVNVDLGDLVNTLTWMEVDLRDQWKGSAAGEAA
ncbi:hypothetical protein N799_05320 [Lysobacter arseniciresistens ZS79]|uniref:Uncharacterized protein n=1 Tax=Lysobacter arseniciresistens ZS79 TaxID=913325 RepID=A0A0A0F2W7_9GAMM|nr:hypothetical protein [Lysobacter arseniciresistens]KGM57486.1 hypothetical protein N799_05320 [Lysobacter arseniciresistens ZS79]